jgi:6-phosphogluconolactonase/glucosamine-6-phosphate isomerase/deaminase
VTSLIPLEVVEDPTAAARRVGAFVARSAHANSERWGRSAIALSKSPAAMLEAILEGDPPWPATDVYQVDERVAPPGDPARNVAVLLELLPPDRVHAMPIEDPDLDAAARRYERQVRFPLDLVHLGLGADGHTASLVPGDPVLEVRDQLVAVTREYEGRRRMTLTYPALDTAGAIVWLVTGEAKRDALGRLLAGDTSIPAGRIRNPNQVVVADAAAAP